MAIDLPGRDVVSGFVEGLAHMGQDAGSVGVVERDRAGALVLTRLSVLPSAPQAVGVSGASGTLVATNTGVVRVERTGTVREIAAIDAGGLYPRSIVEAANGVLFVGMRRYVLAIEPSSRPARVSWYTDAACPRFRPVPPADCRCG